MLLAFAHALFYLVQATCLPGCQDTSVTPLPVYDSNDYSMPGYLARMEQVCCLQYSIPYLPKSGFAIFSVAGRGKANLVDAIISYQVLNAATPVIIAIIGFGWVMYAVERRMNPDFSTPSAGVCACVEPSASWCNFSRFFRPARATRLLLCRLGHFRVRWCASRGTAGEEPSLTRLLRPQIWFPRPEPVAS